MPSQVQIKQIIAEYGVRILNKPYRSFDNFPLFQRVTSNWACMYWNVIHGIWRACYSGRHIRDQCLYMQCEILYGVYFIMQLCVKMTSSKSGQQVGLMPSVTWLSGSCKITWPYKSHNPNKSREDHVTMKSHIIQISHVKITWPWKVT